MEYIGISPRQGEPHGNAKHTSQEYVRTDPKVIDQIKEGVQQKQSCSDIYKNMVFKDPENAPRDYHQIRNIKYNQKKQQKTASASNVADQIIDISSMVNKDDFVKEVVYSESNGKPPSIICYTSDQLTDLQQFLKPDSDRILGIDRTFNLGPVYVTNFVYKNTKVISKETGDHPIFVGPMFLHWEGSFLSYHTFLSHVKARLHDTIQCIDLRIGSDDESGLTKAIDDVFPTATRLLCTKHMKDNVSDYLKNTLGCNDKLRSDVISMIFGSSGLVSADDSFEFDTKSKDLTDKVPEFASYFNRRLKDRLRDHVIKPNTQLKHDRLWTNNNCESVNHVFKKAIDWKPQQLQPLIRSLHDVVNVQFVDLKSSLYGTGNFELCGQYKRHAVSQQNWFSKTKDQKDHMYKRLLSDYSKSLLQSSCGKFEIPLPNKLARKPNQRKRPRTCRTQPRY